MRMQTKSYAPLLSFSAESIAISRYSLAMLASSSRAPSLFRAAWRCSPQWHGAGCDARPALLHRLTRGMHRAKSLRGVCAKGYKCETWKTTRGNRARGGPAHGGA